MSEYQYYEFQAIDRPLDERAMTALRSLTSRARITPTSLANVYHFGDFKGDPDRLMDQHFDAHLYLAKPSICSKTSAILPSEQASGKPSRSVSGNCVSGTAPSRV